MTTQIKAELLNNLSLFRGLSDDELTKIASMCATHSYKVGEVCQEDGKSENRVHFITKGKAGVIIRVPNISYASSEIITENLGVGDSFGWSTLIGNVPWSTLRVIEAMDIVYIETKDLLKLCEINEHIGYILMKNLANLVASRFRRNRMAILNTIVALKGA